MAKTSKPRAKKAATASASASSARADAATEIGRFVGHGYEKITDDTGHWLVDPDTGCITGPGELDDE